MYTYDNGSCVVLVPTIVAMVLATPNSTDYDKTEANGILLELLKQRHPVRKFYDGRSYEDFKEYEVELAEYDLMNIRRYVLKTFLPQMKELGYTSYKVEDECANPIWDSEYDEELTWGETWSALREIANYTSDFLIASEEISEGRFSSIETALFYLSSAFINPKVKHSLYCIPVRFFPKKH